MNCNEKGLGLTAAQIRVLGKFASKEDSDRNKKGVKVVIDGDRAWARATNGINSLELDGASNGHHHGGEWFVDRGFLEKAVKLVVGVKAVLRLQFSGASLNHAIVEENDVETASFDVPQDAALADVSFPWEKEGLKLPSRSRRIAHCSALPGEYAALLQEVEAAVGANYTDLYPPQSPDHPWVFECNAAGQTVARGTLKAAKSVAATKGEDEPEEEDKPKGKARRGRQQELAT
jgi:hypothetical protein